LREGTDVESLGMNTRALVSEDGTESGVWVAAVSAGSTAADAGLEAGDLITEMNGLQVGSDGTMGDYCDILSSAGADGAISVVVLRTPTGDVLEGEFNGTPLAVVGAPGDPSGGQGDPGDPGDVASGDTQTVTSENGTVSAEAPVEWQVELLPDGFNVAPVVEDFNTSFSAPGVSVRLIEGETDASALIEEFLADTGGDTACTETLRGDFDSGAYIGTEVELQCGDAGAQAVLLVGTAGTGNTILALAQATTPADQEQSAGVIGTVTEL
jgi:serine protease Do